MVTSMVFLIYSMRERQRLKQLVRKKCRIESDAYSAISEVGLGTVKIKEIRLYVDSKVKFLSILNIGVTWVLGTIQEYAHEKMGKDQSSTTLNPRKYPEVVISYRVQASLFIENATKM